MTAAVTGFFNFAGWTVPDNDYYGSLNSGATTGSGSLILALDGSANLQLKQPRLGDVPLSTYRWLHGSLFLPEWTGFANTVILLLHSESILGTDKGPKLYAKRTAGSGYVVQLRESNGSTILGTGSTEFSFDTEYEYRIESNGSFVVLDFGSAGSMSEEVNAAYTQQMDRRVRFVVNFNTPGLDVTYKAFGYYTSPNRQDRQRTITVLALPHDDNTPQVDEYPNIHPSGTDKSVQVDDYETGGADGDSTYIRSEIAKGETEGQTLVTPNISLSTVQALKVTLEHRLISADKEAVMGPLIADGFVGGEHSHRINNAATSYTFFRSVFTTDANGNAWTQTRLNNAEYGHELTAGPEDIDVVNVHLTAVHAEAIGSTADAPPAIAVAPQVHHQRHHNMAL